MQLSVSGCCVYWRRVWDWWRCAVPQCVLLLFARYFDGYHTWSSKYPFKLYTPSPTFERFPLAQPLPSFIYFNKTKLSFDFSLWIYLLCIFMTGGFCWVGERELLDGASLVRRGGRCDRLQYKEESKTSIIYRRY